MKTVCILGIQITDRVQDVSGIQDVLSKFGCSIRTRLGLHSTDIRDAHGKGVILLEMSGSPDEVLKLENELLRFEGVNVRKMTF